MGLISIGTGEDRRRASMNTSYCFTSPWQIGGELREGLALGLDLHQTPTRAGTMGISTSFSSITTLPFLSSTGSLVSGSSFCSSTRFLEGRRGDDLDALLALLDVAFKLVCATC